MKGPVMSEPLLRRGSWPPKVSPPRRGSRRAASRRPQATAAQPGGVVAESGTGSGAGTACLHSGLGEDARLVTVERNEEPTRRAARVFADDGRVSVLTATGDRRPATRDRRLLEQHARSTCSAATAAASGTVREGSSSRSPHPGPHATEVLTTPGSSAVAAPRRAPVDVGGGGGGGGGPRRGPRAPAAGRGLKDRTRRATL
ncbi:hypothetical protein ACFWZ6_22215, partial [Streptomyces massasporeus]